MPQPLGSVGLSGELHPLSWAGVLALALLIADLITFDGAYGFLPAALYLAMNATEGQFVTFVLVGRSMSVNPLLIFFSLVFWLWLWGPVGGFIAIPRLIWFTVVTKTMLDPSRREGEEHPTAHALSNPPQA